MARPLEGQCSAGQSGSIFARNWAAARTPFCLLITTLEIVTIERGSLPHNIAGDRSHLLCLLLANDRLGQADQEGVNLVPWVGILSRDVRGSKSWDVVLQHREGRQHVQEPPSVGM